MHAAAVAVSAIQFAFDTDDGLSFLRYMMVCIDALCRGKADLYILVTDGHARIISMCEAWDLGWPASS